MCRWLMSFFYAETGNCLLLQILIALGIATLSFIYYRWKISQKDMNDKDEKEAEPIRSEESPPPEKITRKTIRSLDFKTLEDFGYQFNSDGQMRDIETDEKFQFKIKEDHKYNQGRYEMIGEFVTQYVYDLLEKECGLKRVYVPLDGEEPRSFVFVSDDYKTNKDKLLVLIHGSGVVRAGQWARSLIINQSLEHGTQIPYIKRAMKDGYAIVVLNTNLNTVEIDGKKVPIQENSSPERHGKYVWKEIISTLPAKHIAIVAHSYGGVVTSQLACEFSEEFQDKVFAIALTDSVHSLKWLNAPTAVMEYFKKNAINWVSSDDPIDTPVRDIIVDDAPCVSAGHNTHEWTSWSAIDSIFKFFSDKYSSLKSDL